MEASPERFQKSDRNRISNYFFLDVSVGLNIYNPLDLVEGIQKLSRSFKSIEYISETTPFPLQPRKIALDRQD